MQNIAWNQTMKWTLYGLLICWTTMAKAMPIEVLVTRVIDGDTLEILIPEDTAGWNIHRIRLAGLNTPELASRCSSSSARAKERELARQAKRFVESQVTGPIAVERIGSDSFNRPLVEVWVGGMNLNAKLLDGGYALPYSEGTRGQQWCR